MGDLLSLQNVCVSYGTKRVLHGISLDVAAGTICSVVGQSGCGKSTLIGAILGILAGGSLDSGTIAYRGKDLASLSAEEMREIRGRHIGLVSQNPQGAFHPARRIRNQIRELARCHGMAPYGLERKTSDLMTSFGLADPQGILNGYAFELSGGMCQRTALAMALALRPDLLLADEPTSALDVLSQKQVTDVLAEARDQLGTTILIVSHNMGVISSIADQIVVLYDGRVVEAGWRDTVLGSPLHPYTRLLISSVPRMDEPLPSMSSVASDQDVRFSSYLPSKTAYTPGCDVDQAELREVAKGHFVLCSCASSEAEVPT